ncbi:Acetate transporter, putative [Candida maltosa Xu316]|uniref:Acetate transporter, putative n=1 Tax=Candida maltosa (strain Xu316) TaxID=1245528 RepID=M3IR08_CANMX|nr:Acetate transporter, putative [Candida maltosa Xu316]
MSESDSITSYKANSSSDEPPVARIQTAGAGEEFIILGNTKYYRHELMAAFGGTFDVSPHLPPVHKIANPSPLGLCAFSTSTLVLSLIGLNVKGIEVTNITVPFALFVGGMLQILAGTWELVAGNTFAYCAFTSYGAFYLSYGAIFIPSFGIAEAYMEDPAQLAEAINFFLLGWTLFSFMMLLCTSRSVPSLFIMFVFIFLTFFFQTIGSFIGKHGVYKAGCGIGFGVVVTGLFNAWAGIANPTNSYFAIPETSWIVSKM